MINFFEVKKEKEKYVIKKKGTYIFFLFNFSGNLEVEIKKEESRVFIFGVFLGKNKEKFNLKIFQRHKKEKTFSNLLIKGVFFDYSKFYYQGLIKIEKGANEAFAYQKNDNLILSENVSIETKPYLEILEKDVFCTHGATVSQPNKEQIYYLNSRGISQEKAVQLLINGFLGEVFEKMDELFSKREITPFLSNYRKKIIQYVESRRF